MRLISVLAVALVLSCAPMFAQAPKGAAECDPIIKQKISPILASAAPTPSSVALFKGATSYTVLHLERDLDRRRADTRENKHTLYLIKDDKGHLWCLNNDGMSPAVYPVRSEQEAVGSVFGEIGDDVYDSHGRYQPLANRDGEWHVVPPRTVVNLKKQTSNSLHLASCAVGNLTVRREHDTMRTPAFLVVFLSVNSVSAQTPGWVKEIRRIENRMVSSADPGRDSLAVLYATEEGNCRAHAKLVADIAMKYGLPCEGIELGHRHRDGDKSYHPHIIALVYDHDGRIWRASNGVIEESPSREAAIGGWWSGSGSYKWTENASYFFTPSDLIDLPSVPLPKHGFSASYHRMPANDKPGKPPAYHLEIIPKP